MKGRIGVAVSGGADSVYLLYELMAQGRDLLVLHVNHGLRGAESDGDEAFCRQLAGRLGVEILVRAARVGTGNVEQEARRARYGWFRELVREGVVTRVALGHTEGDQAETVLFRFLRGAGTAGLAGIRLETDLVWRPILGMSPREVRESLRARGIGWREDSSNLDLGFARNRIRQELLPSLEREWNPRLQKTLAQTAEWARGEESYWAAEMEKLAGEYLQETPTGLVVRWPRGLPVAVERRLVRCAMERAKGDLRGIEFGHVEAIRKMQKGRVSAPGLVAERSFEWLRLARREEYGRNRLMHLRFELLPAEAVYNVDEHQLDWGSVSGPLNLRGWMAGDRYRRLGRNQEEKLKVLFQEARVPVWERRCWPVLLCGENIGWTREFGVAAGLERTSRTRTVLCVHDLSGFPNRNP